MSQTAQSVRDRARMKMTIPASYLCRNEGAEEGDCAGPGLQLHRCFPNYRHTRQVLHSHGSLGLMETVVGFEGQPPHWGQREVLGHGKDTIISVHAAQQPRNLVGPSSQRQVQHA